MPFITRGVVKGSRLKIVNIGVCELNDYGKNLFKNKKMVKVTISPLTDAERDELSEEELNGVIDNAKTTAD